MEIEDFKDKVKELFLRINLFGGWFKVTYFNGKKLEQDADWRSKNYYIFDTDHKETFDEILPNTIHSKPAAVLHFNVRNYKKLQDRLDDEKFHIDDAGYYPFEKSLELSTFLARAVSIVSNLDFADVYFSIRTNHVSLMLVDKDQVDHGMEIAIKHLISVISKREYGKIDVYLNNDHKKSIQYVPMWFHTSSNKGLDILGVELDALEVWFETPFKCQFRTDDGNIFNKEIDLDIKDFIPMYLESLLRRNKDVMKEFQVDFSRFKIEPFENKILFTYLNNK